jgi:RsiW-degrading membrane proteinase PrsW (M82 family)
MTALFLLASFPVVVFLIVIYFRDKAREPLSNMIKCFLGGIGSALLTLLVLAPFNGLPFVDAYMNSVFKAFFYAAIPEEFFKFLMLYLIIWKNRHFDQYYDGIVYAVTVSLGFAWIENMMYVFESGVGVGVARALISVPGHGLFGVAMGYYFAIARFRNNKNILWLALFMPILFHGVFNSVLFSTEFSTPMGITLLLLFFVFFLFRLWRTGIRQIRNHLKTDSEFPGPDLV